MDNEALQALLEALSHSPDNVPLRAHVVKEMLRSRRYDQVAEVAEPLLGTSQQATGLLAMARSALAKGDAREAENHYRAAIAQDSSLIDESLEADLEASRTVRCTTSGTVEADFAEPPVPSSVPKINFTDIGGMEQLKEQIRLNILYPMQKPEIYEAYGKKIGGGIMLYGPPGCGKTHLARATAGELGANFFSLSLNEVLNMYIGETEKNLAKLFETCRSRTPSILFIDEVDALGAKRSSINNASTRWMVSHLLTEMDGIQSHNEKVLVLGATNAPWNVDSALRRPGRFDRVLFVPPPDAKARAEILKLHSRKRKVAQNIGWDRLAAQTEHFSGADLANLVEMATEKALAEALRSGELREVSMGDFEQVLKAAKSSTMEWLRRARNYVNFANQDGFYNDLSDYLDKARIR